MTEEWLIDGYNLLHDIQSNKKDSKANLDRGLFYGLLADFASTQKIQTLIVLDGAGDEGELKVHETALLKLTYSQKLTADAWIERYLFEKRATTRLVVVTNDRAITQIARGGGCRVLKTTEFRLMMREAGTDRSEKVLKERVRSHGFNRPFDEKFKDKGLTE